MKCRWNGGVEWKANPLLRECWTFLIYIFLHQQWKQCLEFTLANWEKSANTWLVLAIQTVMPVGYTILLLSAKQSRENQCNEASRLKKMYQKSSALSICFASFLLALLFLRYSFPVHFLQHPLPKKCTLFFCQPVIQKNLFSRSFLCYNFSLFLMNYANYSNRRN